MGKAFQTIKRIGKKAAIAPIVFYQRWISALLPPHCRYWPTCSQYAVEAIESHGLLKGGWLGVRRVLRCHPLYSGGYDPVPGSCVARTCNHSTESKPS